MSKNRKNKFGEAARRADLGFCRVGDGRFKGCKGGAKGKEHKAALDFFETFAGEKKVCHSVETGKYVKAGAPGAKVCTKRQLYTQREWPWGDEREPGGPPAAPTFINKAKVAAGKRKKPLRPPQLKEIEARRAGFGMVPDDLVENYYGNLTARRIAAKQAAAAKAAKSRKPKAPKAAKAAGPAKAAPKVKWSVKKNDAGDYIVFKGKNSSKIPAPPPKTGEYASGDFKGMTWAQRARAEAEKRNRASGGAANRCSCK